MIKNSDRLIIMAVVIILLVVAIFLALPPQTKVQTAGASESTIITSCPPATSEGTYFERGIDKSGNLVCGFIYFNSCPYFDGVPADDTKCVAPTQDQMQPWIPTETTAQPNNNCEAK